MATNQERLVPPRHVLEFADIVSDANGSDDFLLTGGNVIDSFIGGSPNPHDIDVVFRASTDDSLDSRKRLESRGFVFSDLIPYRIDRTKDVIVTTASRGGKTLDIVFVDELEDAVGPLDAISLYFDPNENMIINKYKGLEAISSGIYRCIPGKDFDNENPFVIASRTLAACNKYGASLASQAATIISPFNAHKDDIESLKDFEHFDQTSFSRKVLDAIVKSLPERRVKLISDIVKVELLVDIYDETHEALAKLIGTNATRIVLSGHINSNDLAAITGDL